MKHPWAVVVALLLWAVPWGHGRAASPLQLHDVIDSVAETHPDLEVAEAYIDATEGKALAARGAFDTRLGASTRYVPVGYYRNAQIDVLARQPTPWWGLGLFAGYRLGIGSYPVYKGELQTLSAGEIRAGVELPLLRGGAMDAARARREVSKIETRAARRAADWKRIEVERKAAAAYWQWVSAGLRLRTAESLLATAENRASQLDEQVAAGAVPRLSAVDNQRLVLERRSKVVSAQQEFRQASFELSLYLRDNQGTPVIVGEDRLPPSMPDPDPPAVDALDDEIARTAQRRPDVVELEAARAAAQVQVRYAKNQRLPRLDAQGYVAKDFGEGPAWLRPVEVGVGATLEVAIPVRTARGELQAARADLRAIEAKRRALRDRIGAEVRGAHTAWIAAFERARLAEEQRRVAESLAAAEVERFREGASDLVVVNLRELAAFDAAVSVIEARAAVHRARADYHAVTGRGVQGAGEPQRPDGPMRTR